MSRRLLTTAFALLAFAVGSLAQYKAPAFNPRKALVNPQSQRSLLDNQYAKPASNVLSDSLQRVAKRVAATRRNLPKGPNLKTHNIIDDGTRLMGTVTLWSYGDFNGMGSLRPVDGTYPECVAKGLPGGSTMAYDGTYYYGKDYSSGGGQVLSAHFYKYDATTWKEVSTVKMKSEWNSVSQVMAYNPHDGKIWAVACDGLGRPFLATVNPDDGTHTYVWQSMFTGDLACMAFAEDGTCYGVNKNGELVKVNLTTNSTSVIATIVPGGLKWGATLAMDYHTKKLYFTHLRADWTNALYRVDPQTGSVEKVSDLPDSFQLGGMYVLSPKANAQAPNTVAGLSVNFGANGSTQGTISITAPTTCFDGSALSGSLTMDLYVDSAYVTSRSQNAGSTITIDHNFKTQGDHYVQVVYKNGNGTSPRGTIIAFCGVDTPYDATNVKMTTDDQTGKTQVTWNAVNKGIHDGYVNLSDLTYSVLRMPDSVLVASGIKDTLFTETLSKQSDPKRIYYRVWPTSGGVNGDVTTSNSIVFGKALSTPLKTRLGDDDFNNLIMTENRDGHGDGFYGGWGVEFVNGGYSDSSFVNDKWMYLPAIHLKKGIYYYRLQHEGDGFELYYGKYRTPESQQQNAIGVIDKDVTAYDFVTAEDNTTNEGGYSSYITYKRFIDVKEEGDYYFGIKWSKAYEGGTVGSMAVLRSFEVKEGPATTAPIECQIDSAKTYAKGELKNHIYFTTPTKDYQGHTLTSLSKVEFYLASDSTNTLGRKVQYNKLVLTMDNVEPGKSYDATVAANQGNNIYYFYAYNENGIGGEQETKVWAGIDYPSYVQNPTYSVVNNRDIVMKWDAPSEIGIYGGYVDPKTVTYNMGAAQYSYTGLVTIAEGITDRQYTFYGDAGSQYRYYYGVTPVSKLGEGLGIMVPITIGTPYTAPFVESFDFSAGAFKSQVWDVMLVQGAHSWNARSIAPDNSFSPSDNDGAMLTFYHEADSLSAEAIVTPVMSLQGAVSPTLSFEWYHSPDAKDNYAGITVYPVVDDVMQEPVARIGLSNGEAKKGWKRYEVSLNAYKNKERVYFYFLGSNYKSTSVLGLDDIELYDNVPVDLALDTMNVPAKVMPNEDNQISVEVQNRGRNTLSTYKLGLYAAGELIAEATGEDLAFNRKATLTFSFQPAPKTYGRQIEYEVRVLVDDDANESNNSLKATIGVNNTLLPAPESLTGQNEGAGVKLQWQVPAIPEWSQTRENFESYAPFIIDNIGEWTVYDGDHQLSVAPNSGNGYAADFANNWCAKSFQVWNPSGLTLISQLQGNVMKMYGSNCLISFDAQGYYPDLTSAPSAKTDDWLISPRIAGGTKLRFYAKQVAGSVNETFQVLVSYATARPSDFGVIATDTLSGTNATRYEFDLPADAHYFAIRNVTEGGFVLMIDNIDYTPGYSDLELIGYNVYRDGVKLNTEPITDLGYTDNNSEGGLYGVTAVYDFDGESAMTTVQVAATGIESLGADNVAVAAGEGTISVNHADGLTVTVYNSVGQQVAQRKAASEETFSVVSGVYLVKVGGKSYKVYVR